VEIAKIYEVILYFGKLSRLSASSMSIGGNCIFELNIGDVLGRVGIITQVNRQSDSFDF